MSDLNKRAALALGWTEWGGSWFRSVTVNGKQYLEEVETVNFFDPEHNRNHAQLLLDKVAEEGKIDEFIANFGNVLSEQDPFWAYDQTSEAWTVLNASPWQITEAFVRTMEVWDAE